MQTEEKRISVRFFQARAPYQIQIEWLDNGCGMSKEVLSAWKKPFITARLENGGAGLGLSLSWKVIQNMDGLMEIDSRPDDGCRIQIFL